MFETLSIGDLCGYLGTIWCVLQLVYAMIRNDAKRALVYGIGVFAAVIIALNVGGILNDETWSLLGMGIFFLEAVYHWSIRRSVAKAVVFTALLFVSAGAYAGLI